MMIQHLRYNYSDKEHLNIANCMDKLNEIIDYINKQESTNECKKENKTTKLDEAREFYSSLELKPNSFEAAVKAKYESAIQEIIQQYESKIYSLQAEVVDEANEVVKLKQQKNEAISAYQITVSNLVDENEKLKQQKPEIDEYLIDWLKALADDRFKHEIINAYEKNKAKELLKQLGITE